MGGPKRNRIANDLGTYMQAVGILGSKDGLSRVHLDAFNNDPDFAKAVMEAAREKLRAPISESEKAASDLMPVFGFNGWLNHLHQQISYDQLPTTAPSLPPLDEMLAILNSSPFEDGLQVKDNHILFYLPGLTHLVGDFHETGSDYGLTLENLQKTIADPEDHGHHIFQPVHDWYCKKSFYSRARILPSWYLLRLGPAPGTAKTKTEPDNLPHGYSVPNTATTVLGMFLYWLNYGQWPEQMFPSLSKTELTKEELKEEAKPAIGRTSDVYKRDGFEHQVTMRIGTFAAVNQTKTDVTVLDASYDRKRKVEKPLPYNHAIVLNSCTVNSAYEVDFMAVRRL